MNGDGVEMIQSDRPDESADRKLAEEMQKAFDIENAPGQEIPPAPATPPLFEEAKAGVNTDEQVDGAFNDY